MDYQTAAKEIIQLMEYDLEERKRLSDTGELFKGYNNKMEIVHKENVKQLESIINHIGWPTKKKVGQKASYAAMLIVQHAISLPEFQKACLILIKKAIDQQKEDKRSYAYLYDRICFSERRPQKFGTQFDWDKDGQMSPWVIEDPEELNPLRLEYGLNSMEEETAAIRKHIKDNNEKAPKNYEARQKEIHEWSLKTGWIK